VLFQLATLFDAVPMVDIGTNEKVYCKVSIYAQWTIAINSHRLLIV
jgi:hypothetical protein